MEGSQVPPSGDGIVKPQVWGCEKCARLGKTCCQDREILLAKGDIRPDTELRLAKPCDEGGTDLRLAG